MARGSVQFPAIVTAVFVVAALYFGSAVLIPIALALLFAFILSPLATWLERHRLGHSGSVIVVLFLAVLIAGGLGWVVTDQMINLASQIPNYENTISEKIQSLSAVKQSGLGKTVSAVRGLGEQLMSTLEGAQSQARRLGNEATQPKSPAANNGRQPVPVQIVQQQNPLDLARTILGPLLRPVVDLVITIVFTAFMLARRRSLQERLFTLAGLNRLHITKQAFDEATTRVGRYLYMLCIVNSSYAVVISLALRLIGVPNALLWGVLAGLLRFIPYVGPVIATLLPTFFSLAVSPGWLQPILCLVTFIVVETVVGYFVEPFLYAGKTGISPLAFLVAAIFWAAVWGPIGLLLSTPLTVCLVVGGRYIPQLEFLSVLLGEHAVIGSDVQLYQQLAASDVDSAKTVAETFLQQRSLEDFYDTIVIPVLAMIEREATRMPGEYREHHVCQELREVIEDVGGRFTPEKASPGGAPSGTTEPRQLRLLVSCVPENDEGDEVAAIMLAQLLIRAGYDAQSVTIGPEAEMLDELAEYGGSVIYFSVVPPFTASHLRRLYKRVQARFPQSRIGIGLWGVTSDVSAIRERLRMAPADIVVTRLQDAVRQVAEMAETVTR